MSSTKSLCSCVKDNKRLFLEDGCPCPMRYCQVEGVRNKQHWILNVTGLAQRLNKKNLSLYPSSYSVRFSAYLL